jgi:hypothetical protein
MDTSWRIRSNTGRPGACDPLITMCCALSDSGSVSEPIRETRERTALAPSDTPKSATISQQSSRRSRGGSGGVVHAATA